ncbi:MAG: MFS transporter [Chloroflexota bacterium]
MVFGAREAAWPLIRQDLGLSYRDIGVLLAGPGLVAAFVEPGLGLLGDSGRRRALVLGGGIVFAASLALSALAPGFAWLLVASTVLYVASGAFVSLSQASLMDLDPRRHELNMARWTLAGAVGAVAGPLALIGAALVGAGWRGVFLAGASATLPLVLLARGIPFAPGAHESFASAVRGALAALRRGAVLRWLFVVEVTNLMGDVLLGFIALYFVDVAGLSPVAAGAVVVGWTLAGLAGDALLLPVLARVSGIRYLRVTAILALAAYPALLLVPDPVAKIALLAAVGLLHAGWYAVPQGRLFSQLGDSSGTAIAISSLGAAAGSLLPLAIGLVAERWGLGIALWIPVLAPVALLALTRESRAAGAR